VARALGVLCGPILVPVFLALIAATTYAVAAIALVTFIALLSVTPAVIALALFWAGRATDLGYSVREERHGVAIATIGSGVLALVLLSAEQPGSPLVPLTLGLLGQVALLSLVTFWEKVSYHAAGASALAVGGWFLVGPPLGLPLGLLALAVGWSRCYLGRHSPRQVAIGLASSSVLLFGLLWHAER
jgi:membrane-associated phospholipid phosphatase